MAVVLLLVVAAVVIWIVAYGSTVLPLIPQFWQYARPWLPGLAWVLVPAVVIFALLSIASATWRRRRSDDVAERQGNQGGKQTTGEDDQVHQGGRQADRELPEERRKRREVIRQMWQNGSTDGQIAPVVAVSPDRVKQERHDMGLKGKPRKPIT